MARYEHLPIYKKAFDLTVYLENVVRNFSRYHKYTLGSDLRGLSRKITRSIITANNLKLKIEKLKVIREDLEDMKLLLRLCKEVKAFNNFNSLSCKRNLLTRPTSLQLLSALWLPALNYEKSLPLISETGLYITFW